METVPFAVPPAKVWLLPAIVIVLVLLAAAVSDCAPKATLSS